MDQPPYQAVGPHPGRIPLRDEEAAAVDALIEAHAELGRATITRRDPKDQGPVLVHVGALSFQVNEDGSVEVPGV